MEIRARSVRNSIIFPLLACLCGCGGGGGGGTASQTLYYMPGSYTGTWSGPTGPGTIQIVVSATGAVSGFVFPNELNSESINAQIGSSGQCTGNYTEYGDIHNPAGIITPFAGTVKMTQSPPYVLTMVLKDYMETDTFTFTPATPDVNRP